MITNRQDIPLHPIHQHSFPLSLLWSGWAGERADPKTHYQRDHFPYRNFEYVLEGEGTLIIHEKKYRLQAGDVYTLPPLVPHEYYPNPKHPWRKAHVTFDGPLTETLIEAFQLNTFITAHAPKALVFFEQWQALKQHPLESMHPKAAIILQKLCLELTLVDRQADADQDIARPPISKDCQRLKFALEQSVEIDVQLKTLCRTLDLHERVIARKFKMEMGISPYEYLLQLRNQTAKFLMGYSDYSIQEIAKKLCFSDAYAFSHFFKKRNGISPRAYRQTKPLDPTS